MPTYCSCTYYIHRNPLEAGMVERIADYKWSSYRAYAYGKSHQNWSNTKRNFIAIYECERPTPGLPG